MKEIFFIISYDKTINKLTNDWFEYNQELLKKNKILFVNHKELKKNIILNEGVIMDHLKRKMEGVDFDKLILISRKIYNQSKKINLYELHEKLKEFFGKITFINLVSDPLYLATSRVSSLLVDEKKTYKDLLKFSAVIDYRSIDNFIDIFGVQNIKLIDSHKLSNKFHDLLKEICNEISLELPVNFSNESKLYENNLTLESANLINLLNFSQKIKKRNIRVKDFLKIGSTKFTLPSDLISRIKEKLIVQYAYLSNKNIIYQIPDWTNFSDLKPTWNDAVTLKDLVYRINSLGCELCELINEGKN